MPVQRCLKDMLSLAYKSIPRARNPNVSPKYKDVTLGEAIECFSHFDNNERLTERQMQRLLQLALDGKNPSKIRVINSPVASVLLLCGKPRDYVEGNAGWGTGRCKLLICGPQTGLKVRLSMISYHDHAAKPGPRGTTNRWCHRIPSLPTFRTDLRCRFSRYGMPDHVNPSLDHQSQRVSVLEDIEKQKFRRAAGLEYGSIPKLEEKLERVDFVLSYALCSRDPQIMKIAIIRALIQSGYHNEMKTWCEMPRLANSDQNGTRRSYLPNY
ncbi:hypothetical protein EJ08DRAFT_663301 [Tothia fuscella]|uniref:Uncharacterized protein n=1 Tax=Tothia fuscella TaxID=1048955 RepID=A0A9P4NKU9_9PEZI|nr:hypothetical protein EJ08DRAFT_663301 [Tothia fuscella]